MIFAYINSELNNKLFTKVYKIKKNSKITLVNNFKFLEVKLIKNIISLELLSGFRPKLSAVVFGKKKLLITLKTSINLHLLSYLQKTPVIWSRYLNASLNLTSNFYSGSLTVKNNQIAITTILNKTVSKQEIYIKSAYFD